LAEDAGDADGPERVMLVGDSVAWTIGFYAPTDDPPQGIATIDSRAAIGRGLLAHRDYEWQSAAGGWETPGIEACASVAEGLDIGFEGEPDVLVVLPGAWEWSDLRDSTGTVVPGQSPEMASLLIDRLLELAQQADEVGARTLLVEWACPGPDTDPNRRGAYIPWINEVLADAAEQGTADGLEIAVGHPSESVCVGGDPAARATPEKSAAMGDEVHVDDPDSGRWLWENWLAPMIRETRPVSDERVMILGDSTAYAVGSHVPDDLPSGIASV